MAKKPFNATVDTSGLERKLNNLRALNGYWDNVHKDAATDFNFRLTNKVIGGQFVGVISGNLRRSHAAVKVNNRLSVIGANIRGLIAPYQPYVFNWSENKYGRSYARIAIDLFADTSREIAFREFSRAIRIINSGGVYKYRNPYPRQ